MVISVVVVFPTGFVAEETEDEEDDDEALLEELEPYPVTAETVDEELASELLAGAVG